MNRRAFFSILAGAFGIKLLPPQKGWTCVIETGPAYTLTAQALMGDALALLSPPNPTKEQMDAAIIELNTMLDGWNADRLTAPS